MYRRKNCRASSRKNPHSARLYAELQDMTVASLLFATHRMAAQNPAARERVSRVAMDATSARLTNCVRKTQIR